MEKILFFYLLPGAGKRKKKYFFNLCCLLGARLERAGTDAKYLFFLYKIIQKIFLFTKWQNFQSYMKNCFFFWFQFFQLPEKWKKPIFLVSISFPPPPRGVPREIGTFFYWIGRGSYGQFFFFTFFGIFNFYVLFIGRMLGQSGNSQKICMILLKSSGLGLSIIMWR